MDERLLEQLYTWIDSIPLSRPKKDLKRDFSDGGINVFTTCSAKSRNYPVLSSAHWIMMSSWLVTYWKKNATDVSCFTCICVPFVLLLIDALITTRCNMVHNAYIVILSVCLSVTFVSRLINPGTWLSLCATLCDRSNFRGTSPNFGQKTRGYVQKWYLQYKTSDISETKQSRAKVTQSVYRNTSTAYRLVTNLEIYVELWPTFPRSKFSTTDISHIFVVAHRNLAVLGVWPLANGRWKLIP